MRKETFKVLYILKILVYERNNIPKNKKEIPPRQIIIPLETNNFLSFLYSTRLKISLVAFAMRLTFELNGWYCAVLKMELNTEKRRN